MKRLISFSLFLLLVVLALWARSQATDAPTSETRQTPHAVRD